MRDAVVVVGDGMVSVFSNHLKVRPLFTFNNILLCH